MSKVLVIHLSQSSYCRELFWRFSPHCELQCWRGCVRFTWMAPVFPALTRWDGLTVALHESCCASGSVSFTHSVIWAALTNRILLRGGCFVAELCWRDTGWSSVVGAFWAYSLPAGRVGLRFTAVLNGPWESSVMDSLEPQHTLALCVGDLGTFSLTQCHTH